jgi:hypothetical protein
MFLMQPSGSQEDLRGNTPDLQDTIQMHRMGLIVTPWAVQIGYVCECEGSTRTKGEHMTENSTKIVNWLLGFVIGILTVLAWQRVMSEPLIVSDAEATRADELISIYKRGVRDALKHKPRIV